MKLKVTDVDDWRSYDFLGYIISKLRLLGFDYKVKTNDYIIIGCLLKGYKEAGKSNAFIKQQVDELFTNYTPTVVQSLNFLRVLLRPAQLKHPRRTMKLFKDDTIKISEKTKKKLRDIKAKVQNEETNISKPVQGS